MMKKLFIKWLEKLEKANKDSFGDEKLDCCTVGRNKDRQKSVKLTSNKK